VSLCAKTAYLN